MLEQVKPLLDCVLAVGALISFCGRAHAVSTKECPAASKKHGRVTTLPFTSEVLHPRALHETDIRLTSYGLGRRGHRES